MSACVEGFEKNLTGFDILSIEHLDGPVYALDPQLQIAYHNQAYLDFARTNHALRGIQRQWALGCPVMTAVPECLREVYADGYRRCLNEHTVWEHEYECSSPEMYRRYRQSVHPLRNSAGLLVVNSLLVEELHDPLQRRAFPPNTSIYSDGNGIIHQCAHCRRIEHPAESTRWDWIPAWVAKGPALVSHGLCPVCMDLYYPERDLRSKEAPDAA